MAEAAYAAPAQDEAYRTPDQEPGEPPEVAGVARHYMMGAADLAHLQPLLRFAGVGAPIAV